MVDLSICVPYYEHRDLLGRGIQSFVDCGYFDPDRVGGLEVELSICDDGSRRNPLTEEWVRERWPLINFFSLSVSSLKDRWMTPSVPLNRAVRQSKGHTIFMQGCDAWHPYPVLWDMYRMIEKEEDVVNCPTRDASKGGGRWKDRGGWHWHPRYAPRTYWLGEMMRRSLFEKAGGLDERFRENPGQEDDAFVWQLHHVGANWKWSSDKKPLLDVHRARRLPPGQKWNTDLFKEIWGERYPCTFEPYDE